jgi:competence protein ComEC
MRRFRRTTLWLVLFISVLAGIGLARTGPGFGVLPIFIVAPFLFVGLRRQSWASLVLIIIFGISCGWWRGTGFMQRLAIYDLLYGQKITISAVASEDAVYNQFKSLTFNADNVELQDGTKLVGTVQLSGFGVNAVFQGDEVVTEGKLRRGYGSAQAEMGFAQIEVVARHPALTTEIRRRFVAGTQSALPEPLAPFVMGLLVGQRDTLPQEIKDDFKAVGLTHIIAVSGANLTILLRASQRLIGKRSKRMSTFLTLGLIGVFLLLTGASASIVRAAIVSVLSIGASYYGRSFKPLNLIFMAAAITAWANPIYEWSDLGWYLSFLAFYGVLLLAPLIQARWPARWHQTIIGGVAMESLCAEIMTLPFVLHIFGQMSRVGLVANVLVVAFIPLAMLFGAVAGLAGMFMSSVAGWFAWPAVILLNYMLDVAHMLANLPHVFLKGLSFSLVQMLIAYVAIAIITAVLWFKNSAKDAIITDMTRTKSTGLLA